MAEHLGCKRIIRGASYITHSLVVVPLRTALNQSCGCPLMCSYCWSTKGIFISRILMPKCTNDSLWPLWGLNHEEIKVNGCHVVCSKLWMNKWRLQVSCCVPKKTLLLY